MDAQRNGQEQASTGKLPTLYWIVAIVGLLFNLVGVADYTMSHAMPDAVFANAPADLRAWVEAFPAWATALWALGVWGAFLGSIALLLRREWAVPAFGVSIIGLVGTTLYQFLSNPPASVTTPGAYAFSALIWAVTIGLFLYARSARAKGWLR